MSDKALENAINLDEMLAKREEVIGSRDSFPVVLGGETHWILDPTIADDDAVDEGTLLRHEMTAAEEALDDADTRAEREELLEEVKAIRREFVEHWLGGEEEAGKFYAAGGSAMLLARALETYGEQQKAQRGSDPTRPSSRAIRRRAKRR